MYLDRLNGIPRDCKNDINFLWYVVKTQNVKLKDSVSFYLSIKTCPHHQFNIF